MNISTAMAILSIQDKSLRKANNKRLKYGNHEYRIRYNPGFAPTITIERRENGKRNFKYYELVDVSDCVGYYTAMDLVRERIIKGGRCNEQRAQNETN